jgi:hypothetical protein
VVHRPTVLGAITARLHHQLPGRLPALRAISAHRVLLRISKVVLVLRVTTARPLHQVVHRPTVLGAITARLHRQMPSKLPALRAFFAHRVLLRTNKVVLALQGTTAHQLHRAQHRASVLEATTVRRHRQTRRYLPALQDISARRAPPQTNKVVPALRVFTASQLHRVPRQLSALRATTAQLHHQAPFKICVLVATTARKAPVPRAHAPLATIVLQARLR